MRGKISQLPYVNKIKDSIIGVDSGQLFNLYTDFCDNSVIVPIASGRSKCVMNIPVSQLALMEDSKIIKSTEGPSFPWGSVYEAAFNWETKYKNKGILFLFNTGSGTTEDPRNFAEDIKKYIEETDSKKFTIDVITGTPNSPIGNMGREYGHVLEIKSVEKEILTKKKENNFIETGIMRDLFELVSGFNLQMLVEGLYRKISPDDIYNFFMEESEKELLHIGEVVDTCVNSPFYLSAINALERRSYVFRNSKGPGDEVVKMTLRRISHVKQALGEQIFITNPPRPRAGDVQLSVSYSGNTSSVVNSAKIFRDLGGSQFSVISNKNSELSQNSDFFTFIEEKTKIGMPRRFYMRAAFILSPIPIKLIERLKRRGIELDRTILHYFHSVTE